MDRGGTFTDCVAVDVDGTVRTLKVRSGPGAVRRGVRALFGEDETPLDVRLGTTLATNALLTHTGAKTALLVTRGFGDLLRIGDQTRGDLFALDIDPRPSWASRVIEVDARVAHNGARITTFDPQTLLEPLLACIDEGIRAVAVSLLHGDRHPGDEAQIAELAQSIGFDQVSVSHDVAPHLGYLTRTETTLIDAYLTPSIQESLAQVRSALPPGSRVRVMQSAGGLVDADRVRGKDLLFSGPAGGVLAVSELSERFGSGTRDGVIAFDMGGTSTDVARVSRDHRGDTVAESTIAGARVRARAMDVKTVAAGAGSICRFDGRRLTVGPDSAGADPGPLCYGGDATEPTLTDVALVLGRLPVERFPFPLDRAAAETALRALAERAGMTVGMLCEGLVDVAVNNMASAIREVSVARGHDLAAHAMAVLGGAGGQYACRVARELGITELWFHPHASVLAAWGLGAARDTVERSVGVADLAVGETSEATLDGLFETLKATLLKEVGDARGLVARSMVTLRYRGTDATLELPRSDATQAKFHEAHQRRFGFVRDEPVVIAGVRLALVAQPDPRVEPKVPPGGSVEPTTSMLFLDGGFVAVEQYARENLSPGDVLVGPCVVVEDHGAIVVEAGFRAELDPHGVLLVRDEMPSQAVAATSEHDPARLTVMANAFMSIATQMGAALQRTASSTNIRERLDFSCALFNAEGDLVANAPHIPVHLGAMSATVKDVIARHPDLEDGDAYVTNDPNAGGSHLPDITVVRPVFLQGGLRFFTAARGHHADVGGITPGSMPSASTSLSEEGVVFRALRVVRGAFDERAVREVLSSSSHPARRPDENIADLLAQIAACQAGANALMDLCGRYSTNEVTRYMALVLDDAEACVRELIAELPDGPLTFSDSLDDGTTIEARIEVAGDQMVIDFEGTAAPSRGNLNAPPAVVRACVLYTLRTMVGRPVPLNEGCLRPIEIRIPSPSVLSPPPDAAVSGGNVETSQRIVDVLLGALGLAAASQGTMNNLSFGTSRFAYYETVGGGAGATRRRSGADAVHTHMTNTRITDAEVLETRYPVRLLEFSVRRGSGGDGARPGGAGIVREFQILSPMTVSLVMGRQKRAPFGLDGGSPGWPGRAYVDGRPVPGRATFPIAPGQVLRVETPGGGGFGMSD